ncbi:MAG: hypothetical protein KF824_11725 [Fimbriimonadaceae bacterium]|nr:MAG: hypothetical protein KF824_11725 [Fimbriimonadaceae bacterium]
MSDPDANSSGLKDGVKGCLITLTPILIVLLLPVLGVIGLGSVDAARNMMHQSRYRNAYRYLKHPSTEKILTTINTYGVLGGSSNYCMFWAGEMRNSTLTKTEIKAYYDGIKVWVEGGFNEPAHYAVPELLFFDADDDVHLSHVYEIQDYSKKWPAHLSTGTTYIVSLAGYSDPGWDPACN